MQIDIGLLGPFGVRVDGRSVPDESWNRRDAASLVKVLALSDGHQRHREQVLDLLWPDLDVSEAAPRLHKAAYYARRALGLADTVVTRGDLLTLLPGHDLRVDLDDYGTATTGALADGSPQAADDVLTRFPGEALPSDAYSPWAGQVRDRVRSQKHQLLRQARRWETLVELDPLDEESSVALMQERARSGDALGALREYERLDRAVRRELDVGPGPEAAGVRDVLTSALRSRGGMTAEDEARLEQQIRFCRTADGVTLAYASSGQGPPLVKAANWLTHLDHDWRSPVWRHWLVELSRRHLLVRYDERGCGLSDWEIEDASFESWVTDLETVVDAAGLDRFALLGISQGAGVAVAYAARHPDRVTRMVLYGGYAQGRLSRARDDEDRHRHALQVELARLGWGLDNAAFRQVFTSQFMPDGSRELWDSFNELQRLTTTPENAARVLTITGSIDVRATAHDVRAPTLVLHARQDQHPPFDQGRLLASSIPGSRFVALDSNNHILLGDEPAWRQFRQEVDAFLLEGET